MLRIILTFGGLNREMTNKRFQSCSPFVLKHIPGHIIYHVILQLIKKINFRI